MSKPPSDIPPPASSSPDVFSDAVSPGRRDFLKLTAAAGATLLGGCLNDDDPQQELGATAASIAKFDHMVVVMFENRSFDGLLGYCYQATDPPPQPDVHGLAGKEYRNPVPAYINDGNADVATRISPGTEADMQNPNPDPGEEYQHVNTALFSIVNPITNQFLDAGAMLSPYNAPPSGTAATMQGFVWDYCNNFVSLNKRNPTFEEYRVIMDSFSPEQLPVINGLAKGFAVYDAWFCSVPTQTLPNRSFFHASSSSGFVVNQGQGGYGKWPLSNNAPTIFNRLSDAGKTWRVYYDATQIVPMTALIHGSMLDRIGTKTSTRWTSSTRTSPTGHYRRTRSSSRAASTTTTTTIRRRPWPQTFQSAAGRTSAPGICWRTTSTPPSRRAQRLRGRTRSIRCCSSHSTSMATASTMWRHRRPRHRKIPSPRVS